MDRWNELERIGRLRDDGLLSAEEFEQHKNRILEVGEADAPQDSKKDIPAEDEPQDKRSWMKRHLALLSGGLMAAAAGGLAIIANIGPVHTEAASNNTAAADPYDALDNATDIAPPNSSNTNTTSTDAGATVPAPGNTNPQGDGPTGGDQADNVSHPSFKRFAFADYPATKYSGPIEYPAFQGAQKEFSNFRTRLRDAAHSGPDFAGNISVAAIGCGAECMQYFFINVQTGGIIEHSPFGTDQDILFDQLTYRVDSKLLFETYVDSSGGGPDDNIPYKRWCVYNVYVWNGNSLKNLSSDKVILNEDNEGECS